MIERCLLGGRRKILAAGQPQHSAKFKVPASVAIIPRLPAELMAEAYAQIPPEVRPAHEDTKKSLVAQLATSTHLDEAHVPAKGQGRGAGVTPE